MDKAFDDQIEQDAEQTHRKGMTIHKGVVFFNLPFSSADKINQAGRTSKNPYAASMGYKNEVTMDALRWSIK